MLQGLGRGAEELHSKPSVANTLSLTLDNGINLSGT